MRWCGSPRDCPLTDPAIVDQAVQLWRTTKRDYVANTLEPRSYPDGLDVEVVSSSALRAAADAAVEASDREHVTPYIRRNVDRFTTAELRLEPARGDVRITLDTPDDLELLARLVNTIGVDASATQILAALGCDGSVTVRRRV